MKYLFETSVKKGVGYVIPCRHSMSYNLKIAKHRNDFDCQRCNVTQNASFKVNIVI